MERGEERIARPPKRARPRRSVARFYANQSSAKEEPETTDGTS